MQSLFLTPSAAWLALLAGPLVLFYFLKLKRPQLRVPSLFLWRQVLADQRVNSPFQRFKRSLMLLLQLLMLLLLVTAAMQPVLRRAPEPAERLPVLIDCSASMAALDADGVSRLQAAKAHVRTMIESLLPGQKLCLISFAGSARRLTGFTDNKRVLHAALDAIQVDQVAGELDGALRLTRALSRTEPLTRVLLLSDGVFPAAASVELPFTLEYQRLDPAADNIGLTSLNARRAASGDWSIFVSVEGRSAMEQIATIELSHEGETMVREHLTVEAAVSERMVVTAPGSTRGLVTVSLQPVGHDSLDTDNIAYLELVPARPLRVLVSADLHPFRHALAVKPEVELVDELTDPDLATCDLLICNQESLLASAGAEAVAALTVGLIPSDIGASITVDNGGADVVDWQRGATLLQHVQLDDLVIIDRPVSAAGFDEGSLERLGYEVLVHGADGPLLLQREHDQRIDYHMLFDPQRSTLVYRIGFPILLTNLVHEAAQRAGLTERRAVATGILPPLALSPDQEYLVTGPDGTVARGRTGATGELIGMPAVRVGRYLIADARNHSPVKEVAVSLLDRTESRLVAVDKIDLAELSVAAATTPVETDRPLWPLLVLLALGVVLGEWWLYHRRPGAVR